MADLSPSELTLADEPMEIDSSEAVIEKPERMRKKPQERQVGAGKRYGTHAEFQADLKKWDDEHAARELLMKQYNRQQDRLRDRSGRKRPDTAAETTRRAAQRLLDGANKSLSLAGGIDARGRVKPSTFDVLLDGTRKAIRSGLQADYDRVGTEWERLLQRPLGLWVKDTRFHSYDDEGIDGHDGMGCEVNVGQRVDEHGHLHGKGVSLQDVGAHMALQQGEFEHGHMKRGTTHYFRIIAPYDGTPATEYWLDFIDAGGFRYVAEWTWPEPRPSKEPKAPVHVLDELQSSWHRRLTPHSGGPVVREYPESYGVPCPCSRRYRHLFESK